MTNVIEPQQSSATPGRPAPPSADGQQSGLRRELRSLDYEGGQRAVRPVSSRPADVGAAPSEDDSVASMVPEGVDLQALRLSFSLPRGKVLSGDWKSEARTSSESRVTLEVTPTGLRVWCAPGIHIDAIWPMQNMVIDGAYQEFGRPAPRVDVRLVRGLGEGFVDARGSARDSISGLITQGLANTPAARPGYNPMRDPNIMGTLQAIASNFTSLPTAGGASDVGADDMQRLSAGATIALRDGFTEERDGGGVVVARGGTFDINVASDGSLGDVTRAGGELASGVRAARVRSVSVRSDAVTITKDGEPVIKLNRFRVDRGGIVTVEDLELLGSAQRASDTESALKLLIGLVAYGSRGAPPEMAVQLAARDAEAQIVPGLTRRKVEESLTAAVRKLLTENATVVPGLNLAEALQVAGPSN